MELLEVTLLPKKYRGRGEGSIYQRADGRWEGVLDLGYDSTGRRRRKNLYGKTRKEVQDKLLRAMNDLHKGTLVTTPDKLTLEHYLERWLRDHAAVRVRQSTLASYEAKIRLHINPLLGSTSLTKLQALQLQGFYTEKLREGLSARTVQYLHAILRTALARAVKWGLVSRNVATLVDAPRPKRTKHRVLTAPQAAALLEAASGDRLYALFVLAVTAGLRRGELLGLRWCDLDLEQAVLQVRQIVQRLGKQGLVFGEPKTESSRREVALTPLATSALRKHREHQEGERQSLADVYQDHDLVFCKPWGVPLDDSFVSRLVHRFTDKAGLPRIRFHDLRHTSATLLLKQGVPLKVTAEILGHSTIALTANTYSHVLPEMQREAAQKMEDLLGGNRKNPDTPINSRNREPVLKDQSQYHH